MQVIPTVGIDGSRAPILCRQAWMRAQVAWAFKGIPYIRKCLDLTPIKHDREWFIMAEDSCKLFEHIRLRDFVTRVRKLPPEIEILQTGWRRLTGAQQIEVLDLDTMEYVRERRRVVKIMGQKLLIATRRGIELIGERLIKGQQQYFDVCITELIGMGVAMRDSMPMGGSRRHFSLVDGCKMQEESMPGPFDKTCRVRSSYGGEGTL